MHEVYDVSSAKARPFPVPEEAKGRWRLYPVWLVDEEGVCACPKGEWCESPGKHPATRHGIHDASSDPQEIASMFSRLPGANVGLATGIESGAAALDWDEVGCGGSHRRLQRHGRLPRTRTHGTGSGNLHGLFAIPTHLEHLPSRTIAPGVELKADGVGIVLPPSRTDWGQYIVLDEGPLAELPDWIVEMALQSGLRVLEGEAEGRPTESHFELPERIYERSPSRNCTLFKFGCRLRALGWGHAAILAELRRVSAERCVPPLGDDEVEKIARSVSSRYERGDASPAASPEVLEALAAIEAAVLARSWPGVGGKSEKSIMITLIRVAHQHGSLIPAGVRVGIATRPLAEQAEVPHRSLMRIVHRLRRSGLIRKDDFDRRPADAGAFVLVYPQASPARANCHHSTTPLPSPEGQDSSRATEPASDDTLRAPRLRWRYSLGKGCEAVLDALERAGGEIGLAGLAEAVRTKRPRDLRRRSVARLEAAEIVEVEETEAGQTVRLREGWLENLDRERTLSGEKRAGNLDRAEHERQREAFRLHVADRRGRDDR